MGRLGGAEEDIVVERTEEVVMYPWMRVELFIVAGAGAWTKCMSLHGGSSIGFVVKVGKVVTLMLDRDSL